MAEVRTAIIVLLLVSVTMVAKCALSETLWRCHHADGTQVVITNTPVQSLSGRMCAVLLPQTGSFNRVPSDVLLQSLRSSEAKARSQPSSAAQRKKERVISSLPILDWNFEEITADTEVPAQTKGTNYDHEISCKIVGVIKSEIKTKGVLTISRGALTIDEQPIEIKGDGQQTSWSVILTGGCHEPQVVLALAE